ncbi:MAG: hypothetical protein ACYS1A_03930 [Planctomycetota bacterium]|jgi:predicted RNA-binding Zn-ribbon protein involved in translation (DUF1610 family)
MEEGKKKAIMLTLTVVFLALAGIIFFKTHSGSSGSDIKDIPDEIKVWILCRNPDCEASREMGMRAFFTALEESREPGAMQVPALPCEECGEPSVYRAAKCEKCDLVFEWGTMGAQAYADKCPDCGYSATEEGRKNAARRKRSVE